MHMKCQICGKIYYHYFSLSVAVMLSTSFSKLSHPSSSNLDKAEIRRRLKSDSLALFLRTKGINICQTPEKDIIR